MPHSLTTSRMRAKPKGLASGAGRHSGAALSAPFFSAASSSTLFLILRAQRAQRASRLHLNQAIFERRDAQKRSGCCFIGLAGFSRGGQSEFQRVREFRLGRAAPDVQAMSKGSVSAGHSLQNVAEGVSFRRSAATA